MRAASVRYLNPLRFLSSSNTNNYDPLPGYNDRPSATLNGSPPPYKTPRFQTMTQRYRILRSPTRIILAIVVLASVVGLLSNGGRLQRFQGREEHHHNQNFEPTPTQLTPEQERLEREALVEHWQPFPR